MGGAIAEQPREYGMSDLVDVDHEEEEREAEQNDTESRRDHDGNPTV